MIGMKVSLVAGVRGAELLEDFAGVRRTELLFAEEANRIRLPPAIDAAKLVAHEAAYAKTLVLRAVTSLGGGAPLGSELLCAGMLSTPPISNRQSSATWSATRRTWEWRHRKNRAVEPDAPSGGLSPCAGRVS